MHRMSSQDAAFLHIEDDTTSMHIGSVVVLEGPAPAYDGICRFVEAKLPQVPRYRQTVRFVPMEMGRPVWVDDAHFHLPYHVRHTALPPPGGEEELRNLVGQLMSQQLDRTRPLWEMWFVEGLEDNHWAIVSKLHHCMVDGISATDILTVLLEDRPEGTMPPRAVWLPQDEPVRAGALHSFVAARPAAAGPADPGDDQELVVVRPAGAAHRRDVTVGADRSAPTVGLGAHLAGRRPDRPGGDGRDGQRRHPGHHRRRLPRAVARPRRAGHWHGGALAGAGLGAPSR